jgi:SAM-dependent methyltransferase
VDVEPALFYTGLVAELYRPLRSAAPDPAPYASFIGAVGEPALELGCGDGDPLLELRALGLDVEGVDSSDEMLARCRRRATEGGIDVVLHHQRMEQLDLGRRYRTIFLAGATFNLLPDDETALAALGRIRDHLEPDGAALIPLMIPAAIEPAEIGRVREALEPDGSTIRYSITAAARDEERRRQETSTRYERTGDRGSVLERPWLLHWHTQRGFGELAAAAGLATVAVLGADGGPVSADADVFAFWLHVA